MNLDFTKVCGKHSAIYEAYYKQIDPKASGTIEAMTAAKFLKKSGLSDVVLSRVWDLSDPNGKGFLDKPGFFVALKLVSLAQAGQVSSMNNIYMDTANPPKVGDIPKIVPARAQPISVAPGATATGDWSISVIDRLKYEQLFESLKPVNGMLAGNKVKGVLMESKLPLEILGQIWDLADQDKDGNLDKHEFLVAMHLVYQTLQKRTIPNILPPELRKPGHGVAPPKPAPPITTAPVPRAPSGEGFGDNGFVANFPKDIAPPPAITPLPVAIPPMTRIPPVGAVGTQSLMQTDPLIPIGAPPSVIANADWVVTPSDLQRFEATFRESDRDKDGLVSGLEVKGVFIKSGVPQQCLAHIWALCDTNQSGKLTVEQFALAMWMVERKQKGIEPPQVLTANMVPPSMRSIVSGVDLQPQEPKPTYSNPELEMISKEIEELARERRALETEIAQKEADVRIKNGEVRSLQSELDTLSATLKQLENQRGEAQKRLDDLQAQVNKIREQCQKQEETINEQEGELNTKRSELQKLKDEESALQKEYDENNRELTKLTQHLQNTQLQISSVRSMVTELMETQRQMTDALLICRAAIESQNVEIVSEYQLKIEPDFNEARKILKKEVEMPKTVDPFNDITNDNGSNVNEVNKTSNGFTNDPFVATKSGFDETFSTTNTGFDSNFDSFNAGTNFGQQTKDPFGGDTAYGNSNTMNMNAMPTEHGKDDFGSDPFAALHAPTGQGQVLSPNAQKSGTGVVSGPPPRPESPSPALPPKKSKVPPPRPAPPRPIQGPARTPNQANPIDTFGNATTTSGSGFADFADFDNKLNPIVPTSSVTCTQLATGVATETVAASTSLDKLTLEHFTLFDDDSIENTRPKNSVSAIESASTCAKTSILSISRPTLSSTSSLLTTKTSYILSSTTAMQDKSQTKSQSFSTTTIANNELMPQAITTTINSKSNSNNNSNMSSLFDNIGSANTGYNTKSALNSQNNENNNKIDAFATFDTFDTLKTTSISNTFSGFDAFKTKGHTSNNSKNSNDEDNNNKSVINGPTDFTDDPFKDYRYEDPFNIKDPFADDEIEVFSDTDKVFKDEMSSEDEKPKANAINVFKDHNQKSAASDSSSALVLAPPLSPTTPINNDFLQQFDAFQIRTSPAPSQNSNQSQVQGKNTAAYSAFADFDTFGSTETNAEKSSIEFNDSFFDAFNTNFIKNNNNNASNQQLQEQNNAFAPISKSTSEKIRLNTQLYDAFNEQVFDDDFSNTKYINNNQNEMWSTKKATQLNDSGRNDDKATFSDNNFAKFESVFDDDDDFSKAATTMQLNNSINLKPQTANTLKGPIKFTAEPQLGSKYSAPLDKLQNPTTIAKMSNLQKQQQQQLLNNSKLAEKFAADYSRPDSFDADLEEAIKRSILEN